MKKMASYADGLETTEGCVCFLTKAKKLNSAMEELSREVNRKAHLLQRRVRELVGAGNLSKAAEQLV